MVQWAVLREQFEIGEAVRVLGENRLSRVAALGNVMGNVDHDHASESCHSQKLSEYDCVAEGSFYLFVMQSYFCSRIGQKTGERPVCHQVPPPLSFAEIILSFVRKAGSRSLQ